MKSVDVQGEPVNRGVDVVGIPGEQTIGIQGEPAVRSQSKRGRLEGQAADAERRAGVYRNGAGGTAGLGHDGWRVPGTGDGALLCDRVVQGDQAGGTHYISLCRVRLSRESAYQFVQPSEELIGG
ncbi:hypothetical protein GCM10020295_74170 [Streptomyces cinereospinus]